MKTKISRIGKKSLSVIIALMMIVSTMLVGMVTTSAATTYFTNGSTIYFNSGSSSSWWDNSAATYIKFVQDGTSNFSWVNMTKNSDGYYYGNVPSSGSYDKLLFVRASSSLNTSDTWDNSNIYNNTSNFSVNDVGTNNCYTLTSTDGSNISGKWSNYSSGSGETTDYYYSYNDGSNKFVKMDTDSKYGGYVIRVNKTNGYLNADKKFKIANVDNDSDGKLDNGTHCVNYNIDKANVEKSTSLTEVYFDFDTEWRDLYIKGTSPDDLYIQYTPDGTNGLAGKIKVWSVSDYEGSTEPTTTPTPTTSYYIAGRFKTSTTDTFTGTEFEWDANSENVPFVETETAGIYKVETGLTVADLSGQTAKSQDYFFLITAKSGTTTLYYGDSSVQGTYHSFQNCSNSSTSASLGTVSGDDAKRLIKFNDKSATTGVVTIFLDTNDGMKLYYEVEGGSTTEGAFTITDKTELNGSLSFSVTGKKAGTADAGDTVSVTAAPAAGFTCTGITVTYTDTTTKAKVTIPATGSGNSYEFVVPSDLTTTVVKNKEISVAATFTLDKAAYIASQGDGLWIDVAPDKNDSTATLIKWNNYSGNNHNTTTNPYTFYVPKNVDLTNAKVYNGFDSEVILNSVSIPANSCNTATLSIIPSETNYTTSGGTTSPVKVMQGSTNAMFLYTTKSGSAYSLPTQTGAGASKGDVKTDGGVCITMVNDGETPVFSSAMVLDSVKGRGNSSWEASNGYFGKYAFNMKLAKKTNLFNIDTTKLPDGSKPSGSKSWCLLANNADESMMRNALTYQLAKEIGIQDTPEFSFVDIYDNGEYMGSYLITEKVDVGSSKLVKGESFDDINEETIQTVYNDKTKSVDETKIKTGKYTYNGNTYTMSYAVVDSQGTSSYPTDTRGKYLLEFEIASRYDDETSYFQSPQGQYVVVKSPEFATKEQVEFIATKFAQMEDIVYNSSATKAQLSSVMDVESFAKMYLIQEFSSNLDSAATSYYVTFDCAQSDPVFVASPVWDYDWAYGQYENNAKQAVGGASLDPANPQAWYAKSKKMGDNQKDQYSVQSQLATNSSVFKSVVRKVWEETNGFYDKIQTYYATDGHTDGQIDTWYKQIKDSVNMNETRWGFIASDLISSWGSKDTGDTHAAAVNYFKNDWTATRAAWLNTELNKYTTYTPDVPTIKLYAADGKTEISAVEQGTGFIIKVISTVENNVVYRFFKSDGSQVGSDQSDGILEIATDDLTVGETYTYKVQAVYDGNVSDYSNTVSVTIDDKAGNKKVTIYFKSASASAYVPSLSVDGASSEVMTRNKKTAESDGTYFGSTYSGSLKFYWFYTTMTLDTSVEHTLKFTTKDNRVNASKSYKFVASEGNNYYFAVDNLMGDTELIDLTDKDEYIRNYHISATHMVYSATSDSNIGFTWTKDEKGNYKEYAMGTYLTDNNIVTANLTDLTSSSLLTIPSALTPNAMLQASSSPAFFTIKSATLAQRISAGVDEVSTLQYQLLDVNLDGKVDVKDSTMMQKAIANL